MAYQPIPPTGQATKANSLPVTVASDDDVQTKLGDLTETAPGTDTASSGLNGRLQRIAQRLSTIITNLGTPFQAGGALGASSNNIGDVDVLTLPAVAGGAAQDLPITGNPVPSGYRASDANPTAMSADGDVVYPWATRRGATVIAGSLLDDAAFTIGVDRVDPIGMLADETSTDSVDEGDVGIPRMTLDRRQIVTMSPHTQNGLTTFHLVSAGTTNATNIKNAAGQVYGWYIYNNNAAARKVAFHNSASAPTAGTSVFFSLVIPPNSGANVEMTNGIAFSAGIGITTVTGVADSNSTAVGADDLIINIFYK